MEGREEGDNVGEVGLRQDNGWANICSVNISSVTRPLHPRPDMCTPGDREYSSLSCAGLCTLNRVQSTRVSVRACPSTPVTVRVCMAVSGMLPN